MTPALMSVLPSTHQFAFLDMSVGTYTLVSSTTFSGITAQSLAQTTVLNHSLTSSSLYPNRSLMNSTDGPSRASGVENAVT